MRISPLDIRKQSFKGKLRGADPEEVRIFLDVVASEYEQVLQENAMLVERLRSYEARLADYQKVEANMRDALVKMEQYASESRESTEQRARRLLQDAHGRAERIVEDARERLQSLIREIELLRGKKEVFARRFWTLIEGQIAVLQEHMTDSVEVDTLRQKITRMAADAREAAVADLGPAREREAPVSGPEGDEVRPRIPAPTGVDPVFAGGSDSGMRDESVRIPGPLGRSRDRGQAELPAPDPRSAATSGGFWERPVPAGPTPRATFADPASDRSGEDRLTAVDAPENRAGEARSTEVRLLDSADEKPQRRIMPKGLRSLLRGGQAQLPLGDHVLPGDGSEEDGGSAVPSVERREGFFELRAGGSSREGPATGPRGGNGSDRS